MKRSHIVANVVVAILIATVLWGIPDDLAWLARIVLVGTIVGFIGIIVFIALRFREKPTE